MAIGDLFAALRSGDLFPRPPRDGTNAHRVTVVIGGKQIDGWLDYEIACSMIEPVDGFQLSRPFDRAAWRLLELDAEVQIAIDGVVMIRGFIDDIAKSAKAGTLEIAGRDRAGRLVQESIPAVTGFDGLDLVNAVKKAAAPWFTSITLSDARNRTVRRGAGNRAAAGAEPAFFKVKGRLDEEHTGEMDPGQTRWALIEQLCSSVGVLCWSSADGRELVIGEPNYNQAPQYLFCHGAHRSTVKDMRYRRSCREMYAQIEVISSMRDGDEVGTYRGTHNDGPNADGTGETFKLPKRLVVSQASLQSHAEAGRAAVREAKRRAFNLRQLSVAAPFHGQVVAGTIATLFSPNTIARVIDEDIDLDELWLAHACTFRGRRTEGETADLMLVPRETEFVA